MEYTIYSESLVFYALQDNQGRYLTDNFEQPRYMSKDTYLCDTIKEAEELQKKYPEFSQIRKMKLIDIGEKETNNDKM